MKILLVEDDRTIASGLVYSLQQENYETVLCHSATSATEVINNKIAEFDLCLFDLNIPDGSGYDLCMQVKKHRDIPVIFITAYDDEVNVVMGLDMGADDYITNLFGSVNFSQELNLYNAATISTPNRKTSFQ